MSKFLDILKDSLDKSEFNSDIAKKMTEINELADKKIQEGMTADDLENSLLKKAQEGGIKSISEEEVAEINQEYEKKLAEIKRVDAINKDIALLVDIEDAVQTTIEDMFYHIKHVEAKYGEVIENKEPIVNDLLVKIADIKKKFKSFIN